MGSGKGQPSGGSSGTQQVNSTTTTSNIPEYARPYFESLMNRAQTVSNDPYQSYTGQRIAGFTDPQNQAFQNIQGNQGIANGNLNQAGGAYNAAAPIWDQSKWGYHTAGNAFDSALNTANTTKFDPNQVSNRYQAQNYNPNTWIDPGVASQYMSPYQQNVTDIQKREANRQFGIQNTQNDAAAAAGGAFGGYRQGVVQAEAQRNQQQLLNDIQQQGSQSAYQSGLGAFNQDRSALIGANQLNNQYGQQESQLGMSAQNANNQWAAQAAQLGLQGGQLALGAGQGLTGVAQGYGNVAQGMQGLGGAYTNLGQVRQQSGLTDAQSLLNVGQMQQGLNQQGMDVNYSDFLNQRDFGRQNLGWLSSILRGTPVSANSNVTSYQPAPSQFSQVAGLGLGAAGLSRLLS